MKLILGDFLWDDLIDIWLVGEGIKRFALNLFKGFRILKYMI